MENRLGFTGLVKALVIGTVIGMLFRTFICFMAFVPSNSMKPTISERSILLVSALPYLNGCPKRNDIVVFDNPDGGEQKKLVKRCIGLPGETLEIKNGSVYINNEVLDEPFLEEKYDNDYTLHYIPMEGDVVKVVNGYAFVDGILVAKDSFAKNYCTKKDGQYVVNEDCFFFLGDNVNNSLDARYWDNQYVTKKQIKGKVLFSV